MADEQPLRLRKWRGYMNIVEIEHTRTLLPLASEEAHIQRAISAYVTALNNPAFTNANVAALVDAAKDAEIERLRVRLSATAKYLDDLQSNMLRNDVDMLLDRFKAPEIVASELRALAGIPEPSETKE